jgi:hypothetical protein
VRHGRAQDTECTSVDVLGCTDSVASNYQVTLKCHSFPETPGFLCVSFISSLLCMMQSDATDDDGSCAYDCATIGSRITMPATARGHPEMTTRCIIWDGDEDTGQWTGTHGTWNLGGPTYARFSTPGHEHHHHFETSGQAPGGEVLTRSTNWTAATWIDGDSWRGPAGVKDLDDAIVGMTSQPCTDGEEFVSEWSTWGHHDDDPNNANLWQEFTFNITAHEACASKCPYAGLPGHPSHAQCTSNTYHPYRSLTDMMNRPANDPQVGHDCIETGTFRIPRYSLWVERSLDTV